MKIYKWVPINTLEQQVCYISFFLFLSKYAILENKIYK